MSRSFLNSGTLIVIVSILCNECGPILIISHFLLRRDYFCGRHSVNLWLFLQHDSLYPSLELENNVFLSGVGRPHRKKKFRKFPVPSRDVTTKLSLGGNNDVITELFLPRGSLVSDIPAGDGKLVNLFLRCKSFPILK